MPYQIIKNKDNTYKVVNKITGLVHAKNTTLEKAKKQIKLMEYLDSKKYKK